MKKKYTKKDFAKFNKINTHKRRDKERRRLDLLAAIENSGVAYSDGLKIRDVSDRGGFGKNKKAFKSAMGIFSGSKSGFGFVTLEEGYDRDIFIPEDKTLGAIDGDYVRISYKVFKDSFGAEKTEGRVEKIERFGIENVIGTLTVSPSYMRGRRRIPAKTVLIPDDPRINVYPIITYDAGAKDGDKVMVKLDRGGSGTPCGTVISIFGSAYSKEANYEAILADCGIETEFSEEEIKQAEMAARREISDTGRERIKDTVFTMDSESALDLDDAVSLRRTGDGWLLGVHIADVSSYVDEKTALDRAVMRRGTSVYFTDKVVPMLPACLSNGSCSLNPGEDKYTLSAMITLDTFGEIKDVKIKRTVINSKIKGIYKEMNSVLDGSADRELKEKYKKVTPALLRMKELYEVLLKKSQKRGALELEIDEAKILLDKSGAPTEIVKIERGVCERIIEQFMLTANEAVATYLSAKGIPCVYRVHEPPSAQKFSDFLEYLKAVGIGVKGIDSEKVSSEDLAVILQRAEEKGLMAPVSYSMLRAMSKAKYSEVKALHFGLGLENYCHFTSPIRRLSDLATHRIINKTLNEGKRPESYASYAARAARAATDAELKAVEAERRIENLYKVIYMSDRIGEEYDGVVCSVASFGLFVKLDNTCEGLIPISELGGMFVYDEKRASVSRGLVSYRLGDRVRIKVAEADIIRGKLRFEMIDKIV